MWMFQVLFSDHILGSCESHIEAECSLYGDVFLLKSLLKRGYSEKSANIDVQFFFQIQEYFRKKGLCLLKWDI